MSVESNSTINEKWVLIATILPSSIAFLATSILNIALPAIQADFDAPVTTAFWVLNIYMLFLSALILLGGSLGDHFGRKRIFIIGIWGFTIGSTLCGFAPSIEWLIVFRAIQGVGGALMVPGSLAILSAVIAPQRRGIAIGTWSTFSTFASLIGLPLGGVIVGAGLWRMIFWMNIPLGLITIYILNRYVPETHDADAKSAKLDYWGAFLITASLAGLTYGLSEIGTLGISDPLILIALGVGIGGFILFLLVESGNPHALVPFYLFKNRTFSGANLLTLFLYAALNTTSAFLPINMIQVQGYNAEIAGFAMLPIGVGIALLGRRSGKWVDRIGARPLLTAGPIITGVGFALLGLVGLTNGASDYWTTFFIGLVFVGIGMGLVVAPLTTAVMGSVPVSASGTASGINNAVSRVAGVLALAVFGAVMISLFTSNLMTRTEALPLDAQSRAFLQNEASRLAEAAPPPDVSDELRGLIQSSVDEAFIESYRLVMLIMAGMAILGGLFAFIVIKPARK
jgi:EmrB/QacA subfamily drug resistance transporter